MRLKSLILLFGIFLGLISLNSCSRESSIKENVNLRNNHSVVFIFRAPFENPEAFADSIINLPNPDSVIVSDTITVTIGDTVHMMGFLRYNADKIYLYQWILDSLVTDSTGKQKMKKALVTSHNATPQSWVYKKEGVYSPLFVAIDGNSATDTAGKDQYIRVINTPPYLGVPKDTLWTKAKSPITFPVFALDSFGTITSFMVDLDAQGKKAPQNWKYTRDELTDSLLVTIPYDSTLTDSLGNQKIYILVTDDDKNTTKDSVYLHFNQLPTIKILGPDDKQRISDSVETFRLFYEGHDKDNEDQLRYYVRVAATPDDQESDLNLSNVYDLVLKNSTSTSFSVIEDGVNYLKKLGYTGRYFSWDVWVTDGYDTVVVEKIKTSKGKRPRFFYLGPNKITCDFYGIAKYEGLSNHEGIKITLINNADTNNIYSANVRSDGSFRVDGLPAGSYKLIASDESGRGFRNVVTKTPAINAGDEKELPMLLLKDPAPPRIYSIKGLDDTLFVRDTVVSGKFSDYGSQVKTVIAVLDKDTCGANNEKCKFSGRLTSYAWSVQLSNLLDGSHTFKITAIDSAGYKSDTSVTFYVSATAMAILVNDKNAAMVGSDDPLVFTASIKKANPPITKVTWISNVPGAAKPQSAVSDAGVATITLRKSDFPNAATNTRYTMHALSDQGHVSNTVRFGFYGDGPMIIITAPDNDTTISIKDPINMSAEKYPNSGVLTWTCEGSTPTQGCPAAGTTNATLSWSGAGTKLLIAKVEDNSESALDTLRVNVVADLPTIRVDDNEGVISKKVNGSHQFEVTAKDKFGYIKELAWKCTNNSSWTTTAIDTVQDKLKLVTRSMTITGLPSNEVSNYRCIVRATDDDDQFGYDTLTFNIIRDVPRIRLEIKSKPLTINDQEQLKYTATNILGGPIVIDYKCDKSKANLATSSIPDQANPNGYFPRVTMPSTPGNYYCVARAKDPEDGSLYSLDTATYTVYRAPPTVTVASNITRTIKDTLTLYANAQDSAQSVLPGGIVSYEWGCGTGSESSIINNLTQTNKNTFFVTLPDNAQPNYLCIVRVTDDDGLSDTGFTHINVELAPPTVTVTHDSILVRPGYRFVLGARAQDKYEGTWGYIVKREWSCGYNPSDISQHWKEVSTFDTSWTAPSTTDNFKCVARATDDDGNTATDTTWVFSTTKQPAIMVSESQIHVVQGDVFLLNASINDAWQGVDWFTWQCFYQDTKKPAEPLDTLAYNPNGSGFYDYREFLSQQGKDLYCVVSAKESITGVIFRDTTKVNVLSLANDLPVAKITGVDTIYPWSGDEAQSGDALYYYSPEWSGSQSVRGTLGDDNLRDYYWRFSNVGSTFYHGLSNGGIDTSIAQFNDAFRRPTSEGSFSVCLDFRDSILASNPGDATFLKRHQAQVACRNVYVRRAWKNLAKDTVLDTSSVRIPPAITVLKSKLTVAYVDKNAKVAVKYRTNDTTWTTIPTGALSGITDPVKTVRIANNGTDLYLAVLTETNKITVFQSTGGTSSWTKVASTINDATSINLTTHPSTKVPVITYAQNGHPYFGRPGSGTAWNSTPISSDYTARDVNSVFASSGSVYYYLVTFTDNSYRYTTYFAIYDANYAPTKTVDTLSIEMGSVSLATAGTDLYLGYISRSSTVGAAGPYVKKGEIKSNRIEWSIERNLQEGMLPTNLRVAARGNKAYAIIDDNGRGFSHVHAYRFNGTAWEPYGENQLPYFKGPFYSSHGYNLYGFAPEIAISDGSDASVYISMISWTSTGALSQNNGPIVMKNVSENWTFNTKP